MFYKTILDSEFMYDDETDELFRFSKQKHDWKQVNINHKPTKTHQYIRVTIDKKSFQLHRIIYYLCNEDFDIFDYNFVIDHADRNTGNNKLSNLSKRTHSENNQNKNSKGMVAVLCHCKYKEPLLYFHVNWHKDKKRYQKRIKNYWIARWLRNIKTSHYYHGIN